MWTNNTPNNLWNFSTTNTEFLLANVANRSKMRSFDEQFFFCENEDQEQFCFWAIYLTYDAHESQELQLLHELELVNQNLSAKSYIIAVHDGEFTYSGASQCYVSQQKQFLEGVHYDVSADAYFQ